MEGSGLNLVDEGDLENGVAGETVAHHLELTVDPAFQAVPVRETARAGKGYLRFRLVGVVAMRRSAFLRL